MSALVCPRCACGRDALWWIGDTRAGTWEPMCGTCDAQRIEREYLRPWRAERERALMTRAGALRQYLQQGRRCAQCERHLCRSHDHMYALQGSIVCALCAATDGSTR